MLAVEGESSHLPEVGEVPYQPERHIFPKCQFSKSKVVSHAFQGLISGSGYTTSQQLTACLCLEANTDLHCLEYSELFFMHVSVSNLHFPQMKLASEKPPESVLEGVIFKIFLGKHACPDLPYIMACKACHFSFLTAIWPDRFFNVCSETTMFYIIVVAHALSVKNVQ